MNKSSFTYNYYFSDGHVESGRKIQGVTNIAEAATWVKIMWEPASIIEMTASDFAILSIKSVSSGYILCLVMAS